MVYVANAFYADTNYLEHHGVLNMKWGVRRWQNKDGTLTEAGRRRLAKLKKQQVKLDQKKEKLVGEEEKESKPSVPKNPHVGKSIFSMSDDELRSEINRLDLEKRYKQYMSELYPESSPKSKTSSRGKAAVDNYIKPALSNVGKQAVENVMGMGINKLGKTLGLSHELYTMKSAKNQTKDSQDKEIERLKNANERLQMQNEINRLKQQLQQQNDRRRRR